MLLHSTSQEEPIGILVLFNQIMDPTLSMASLQIANSSSSVRGHGFKFGILIQRVLVGKRSASLVDGT